MLDTQQGFSRKNASRPGLNRRATSEDCVTIETAKNYKLTKHCLYCFIHYGTGGGGGGKDSVGGASSLGGVGGGCGIGGIGGTGCIGGSGIVTTPKAARDS